MCTLSSQELRPWYPFGLNYICQYCHSNNRDLLALWTSQWLALTNSSLGFYIYWPAMADVVPHRITNPMARWPSLNRKCRVSPWRVEGWLPDHWLWLTCVARWPDYECSDTVLTRSRRSISPSHPEFIERDLFHRDWRVQWRRPCHWDDMS